MLVVFIFLLAGFSLYHLPGMNSAICILALLSIGLVRNSHSIFLASNNAIQLFFIYSILLITISILLHFQIPNIGVLLSVLYTYVFLRLKGEYRYYIYHRFVTVLAVLLFLSIVEHVLYLITGFFIQLGEAERSVTMGSQHFYHAVFNVFSVSSTGFCRFQSLADEPGRIGTLCGFLLFTVNPRYYKKQFVVFIIAGLLSLSLAFYALLLCYLFISVLFFKKIKYAVGVGCVLLIGYFYNQDKIDYMIIDRVQNGYSNDELDNRVSYEFKRELNRFYCSEDIFLGRGYGASGDIVQTGGNAGLQRAIYEIGVLGVFFWFLIYNNLFVKFNKFSFDSLLLLGVIWISYYQRDDNYFPPNTVLLFAYKLTPTYYNIINQIVK